MLPDEKHCARRLANVRSGSWFQVLGLPAGIEADTARLLTAPARFLRGRWLVSSPVSCNATPLVLRIANPMPALSGSTLGVKTRVWSQVPAVTSSIAQASARCSANSTTGLTGRAHKSQGRPRVCKLECAPAAVWLKPSCTRRSEPTSATRLKSFDGIVCDNRVCELRRWDCAKGIGKNW
jgi:hypothetical protein